MMFFFRKDRTQDGVYHADRGCRLVPKQVVTDSDWMMSNLAPPDRSECQVCGGQPSRPAPRPAVEAPRETVPTSGRR
jgi:hypothetical protein